MFLRYILVAVAVCAMARCSLAAFDSIKAFEMLQFSSAVDCKPDTLTNWTCKACDGPAAGFQYEALVWHAPTNTKGFVGYLPSKNQAVISFQGSKDLANWISDLYFFKVDLPLPGAPNGTMVHSGFFDAYKTVRSQVHAALASVQAKNKNNATVVVTGHSLGGALSVLCALDLAVDMPQLVPNGISVVNFGCPRVGNPQFASYYESSVGVGHTMRVVHHHDIVPHLPMQTLGFRHEAREYWQHTKDYTGPSDVTECDGSGEDKTCSDSVGTIHWSALEHTHYLGWSVECVEHY